MLVSNTLSSNFERPYISLDTLKLTVNYQTIEESVTYDFVYQIIQVTQIIVTSTLDN